MISYKKLQYMFDLMTDSQKAFRNLAISTSTFSSRDTVWRSIIHIKCEFPQYNNVYPKSELDMGYKNAAICRDCDYLQWWRNDQVFFNKSLEKYKGMHYWEFLEKEFNINWLEV